MKTLVLILLCSGWLQVVMSQNYHDSLHIALTSLSKTHDIPGFGVSIVTKDTVIYCKGYGHASVEKGKPYTTKTIQNIGSISKTVLAFSLMKLVEERKIELDAPINRYLPFSIVNPHYPNSPITIRQLATHTSSLTDGSDDLLIEKSYLFEESLDVNVDQLPDGYSDYFSIYKINKSHSMIDFIQNTYLPHGEWYTEENFIPKKPGTTYHYSNIATTVLAYIIEQQSQMTYSKYTKETLLHPLGLTSSHWNHSSADQDKLSSLYLSNGLKVPHYNLITYPDGGLFTSIADFSIYLQEMIKGINGESELLTQKSYKQMMSNQLIESYFPEGEFQNSKGLLWTVNYDEDNISANGADPGIATWTMFTTAGNVGLVIFMNQSIDGNDRVENQFKEIRNALFQYTGKLLQQN